MVASGAGAAVSEVLFVLALKPQDAGSELGAGAAAPKVKPVVAGSAGFVEAASFPSTLSGSVPVDAHEGGPPKENPLVVGVGAGAGANPDAEGCTPNWKVVEAADGASGALDTPKLKPLPGAASEAPGTRET